MIALGRELGPPVAKNCASRATDRASQTFLPGSRIGPALRGRQQVSRTKWDAGSPRSATVGRATPAACLSQRLGGLGSMDSAAKGDRRGDSREASRGRPCYRPVSWFMIHRFVLSGLP
jgi:hypothetical protein